MKLPDIPVANFTISENAKHGIDNLRQAFNARSSDPAMVPTVGWAKYMPNAGDPYEQVAVTFYGRSQYDEIAAAIQIVSGIEVVSFRSPGTMKSSTARFSILPLTPAFS
jgi:hypothetical protein